MIVCVDAPDQLISCVASGKNQEVCSGPHHSSPNSWHTDEAVSIEFRAKKGARHSDHIWRYGSPKSVEKEKQQINQVRAADRDPADEIRQR